MFRGQESYSDSLEHGICKGPLAPCWSRIGEQRPDFKGTAWKGI